MSFQSLVTWSQVFTLIGLVMAALGGFGSYYFQKRIKEEENPITRPVIDICHRGISVTKINDSTTSFDIPYCSGKSANAYDVKLESAVLLNTPRGLHMLNTFSHPFPDGIHLTYETGKSIEFVLEPFNYSLNSVYICIKGSYTNEKKDAIFPVFDIFKFNSKTGRWIRTLGKEDEEIRKFLNL
ncbi:hypothetical protein GS399_00625 [Pedobacter sp. HMF7647]|uniref:Uncharacterized protein n=1 Tax=Hufsiella arboris TaxID=2695275 RepID=A0A7K1Y5S1_9SPHI|nr:hypothetical protein [Hufsiella arboris]MXV49459.1 hypothetical protein [Hufsiella arboris]